MIRDFLDPQNRILLVELLLSILGFYGAFENLVRKRLSLFGLDRFFYLISSLFVKNVMGRIKKNPTILRKWGLYGFLMAIGGILDILLNH